MGADHSDTQTMRTWFGLTARVTIGPGFIHKAGIGRLAIPHPPVANWMLRQGMPADLQRKLSFVHEFAHFQTAPVVLVAMIALVALAFPRDSYGIAEILILLVGTQALWEILSEGLVILAAPASYYAWYKGVSPWPRIVFWSASLFVVAAAGLSFVKLTS